MELGLGNRLRLPSLLGALAALVGCHVLLGTHLKTLFQPGIFLGVAGVTLLSALHRMGPAVLRDGLRAILGDRPKNDARVREFSESIGFHAMLAGQLIALVGVIHVMMTLDQGSEVLGSGLVKALLGIVYGAMLTLVLPRASVEKAAGPRGEDALTAFFFILMTFFVVMYSLSAVDYSAMMDRINRAVSGEAEGGGGGKTLALAPLTLDSGASLRLTLRLAIHEVAEPAKPDADKKNLDMMLDEIEARNGELDRKTPELRRAVAALLKAKRPRDLTEPEGQDHLRSELKDVLNSRLTSFRVQRVSFSELILTP